MIVKIKILKNLPLRNGDGDIVADLYEGTVHTATRVTGGWQVRIPHLQEPAYVYYKEAEET